MKDASTLARTLLLVILVLVAVPTRSLAVSDGSPQSRSMYLVGSARANGMGEMTTVLHDGPIALWWNPGMLALDDAWRFEVTRSRLAKGVTDDIDFSTSGLSGVGTWGPCRLAGAFGYARLDLGTSDIILENGERIGTFTSGDELFNFAFGASLLRAFSAGIAAEFSDSDLSPAIEELAIEEGHASAWSYGAGIAVAPRFDHVTRRGREAPGGGFLLFIQPLFGMSWLHQGEGKMVYNAQNRPESLPRQTHVGYGFRFGFEANHSDSFFDLRRLLSAEFLYAEEQGKNTVWGGGETLDHRGVEIGFANVFAFRWGRIDRSAEPVTWPDVIGRRFNDPGPQNTWGFGIGLEEALPFGLRIDYANIPQADDLPRLDVYALAFSLDPRRVGIR